jgi:lyso-ornithine lipid O-acyltransferase
VRVLGQNAAAGTRPVIYAANHCSWLDIPVLGGQLPACFVSKAEVQRWPLISTVARLGRTVFVSRTRAGTARECADMRNRLQAGDNLILFPEGTSSDGARVLPFRSSFFGLANDSARPPLIQPVSIAYDRLGGLPPLRRNRPLFAWYGDMDLGPSLWRLTGQRGLGVTIHLHPPLDPAAYPTRKALALACWTEVAQGAAQLRQGRVEQANAGFA